jgi:lysophospholipid acyltransferase
VSLFYLVGLFDLWSGIRTILLSSIGAYSIAKFVQGPFMPWIGFVFLMGHLSANHLLRMGREDQSAIDVTGAQMVLVMKLSAFCWNVHDGRLPVDVLSDHQRSRALPQLPNLLDFTGYVFFFPALFAGPSFDFAEYRRWLDLSQFDIPATADKPAQRRLKIPRATSPALWKLAVGLIWVLAFLQMGNYYWSGYYVSDEYMKYGILRRIWQLYMFGFASRLKYYGIWTLTEGACILSGLGYKGMDPKTGRIDWSRLQNVNPWRLETAQNSRGYLENWNVNTNNWLRNYVYLRVTPRGKKPGFRSSLATFGTSAFWHGFWPGYYLTFVLGSLLQTIAKNFRRYVRPFFLMPDGKTGTPYKIYYDAVGFVATQVGFSFATAPFVLLDFKDSLLVWSRVDFYGIIGTVLGFAFFSSPAKGYLLREIKKRTSTATAGKVEMIKGEDGITRPVVITRTDSTDSLKVPLLGMTDLEKDIKEAVNEVKAEIEERRRNGSSKGDEKVGVQVHPDGQGATVGRVTGREL